MLIKSENVSVTLGKKEILKNINLEVNSDDFVTIIGPNGAGKSMLLKCLLGFFKPDNGQIIKSPDLKVSYVPQDFISDKFIVLKFTTKIGINLGFRNLYWHRHWLFLKPKLNQCRYIL